MDPNEVEIILVEDNPDDAALTIHAFKQNKIANSLVHLRDGQEAFDYIYDGKEFGGRKFSDLPKVILLDLKMPKINGIEVLERLKSDPKTKTIPVVVLTSSAEDPDIKRCYELGANSYIVKPVEFENFTKSVVELGVYWLVLNKTT